MAPGAGAGEGGRGGGACDRVEDGEDDLLPADGAGVEHGVAAPGKGAVARVGGGGGKGERGVARGRGEGERGWRVAWPHHHGSAMYDEPSAYVPSHPSDLSLRGGAE